MRKLADLHESYVRRSQQGLTVPSQNGFVTIRKSNASVPLVPVNKWTRSEDKATLQKRFEFRKPEQRVQFLHDILEYEVTLGHNAKIVTDRDSIELTLTTHDLGTITELDKEYSKYADELYRDIVYSS